MFDSIIYASLSSLAFIFLFVYLPGKVFHSLTKLPDWFDLHLIIGLAILPLILFFGRFFLPNNLLLAFYLTAIIIIYKKTQLRLRLPKLNQLTLFFIIIGVLAQSLPYLKTIFYNQDQILTAIAVNHDQAWHLSLINQLVQSFPPSLPGFSGLILENYHYFYDLILAAQTSLFKPNPAILLQLVYPVFFSVMFGLASYRVLTLVTNNKIFQSLGILLVYFSNNLSYLLYSFDPVLFASNSLLIDQPLFYIFNHQTVLSLALALYLFILIDHQIKKPLTSQAILIGLCLASLSYIKAYAFVVVLFSLGFVSLKHIKSFLPTLIVGGLSTLAIFLPTYNPGQSWLKFQPLWLVSAFSHQIIAPNLPQLFARSTQFWFPFLALLLLLALNYHFNLFGLAYLRLKQKTTFLNLIFISVIISFALLFLGFQDQSPHNIIQFAPYATTGLAILAIAVFAQFKSKLGLFLPSLVLLISFPTSMRTITSYAKLKPELAPLRQEYFQLIKSLKPLPRGLTLSLIDRDYYLIPDPNRDLDFIGNNLINSISNQAVFFNDVRQLKVLNIDYQSRLDQVNHLKHNFCQDKSLLINQNINYLIIADDLSGCLNNSEIEHALVDQTDHFSLFSIKPIN